MRRVVLLKSRVATLGGLERYALYLARAFHQKGCLVTLLTTGPLPPKEDFAMLSLHSPSFWGVLSILNFHLASKKWLEENPSDFIFSLDRTPFTNFYRAGNGSHLSYLLSKKNTFYPFFLKKCNPKNALLLFLEKKLFQSSKLKTLYTNSFMVKNELIDHYKLTPSKIKVIHNGVDLSSFPLAKSSSTQVKLLFVGNDYKRKGLGLLLEALASLKQFSFQLVVIGKDKRQKAYEKKAQHLGLDQKVLFKGPQKNLLLDYQAADCFVLPTKYDPFANVTLEALAMGLFVITSLSNGAKEIIKEGCGYILSSLESPDELQFALKQVLEKKKPSLSKKQIRSSVEHLSLEKQISSMVDHVLEHEKN